MVIYSFRLPRLRRRLVIACEYETCFDSEQLWKTVISFIVPFQQNSYVCKILLRLLTVFGKLIVVFPQTPATYLSCCQVQTCTGARYIITRTTSSYTESISLLFLIIGITIANIYWYQFEWYTKGFMFFITTLHCHHSLTSQKNIAVFTEFVSKSFQATIAYHKVTHYSGYTKSPYFEETWFSRSTRRKPTNYTWEKSSENNISNRYP